MNFNKLPALRRYLDHFPECGNRVYVDDAATVIGRVRLGDDVSIWPGAVVRGDVNRIDIGALTNIQDLAVLHVTHDGEFSPGGRHLELGVGVTVGHAAILHACTIGDYCLIGMGAKLLDDVIVESNCLIAAGSLVAPGSRVESGWLWRGVPAKPARLLTDREIQQLSYSAEHYVKLKNHYLESTGA